MRRFILVCLFALATGFPESILAQDVAYRVADNFDASGQVVELTVPASADGTLFYLVWTAGPTEGTKHEVLLARAGTHCHEMRNNPGWTGHILFLGSTIQGVTGRIRPPTLADEIDMFLEPQRIEPSTINALRQHTIFALPWNDGLLLILLLTVLIATFRKKRLGMALGVGFLVAWGVMDLRTAYDHAVIVYKTEKYHEGTPPMNEIMVFGDRAADLIGKQSWGSGTMGGVTSSYLRYRLAERKYVPPGSSEQPVFWITNDDKTGNYSLEKKAQP